jgi:WD40 repeat protein
LSLKAKSVKDFNVYKGHNDAVNSIVFWPSASAFYTASSDGKIIRWELSDSTKKPNIIIDNKLVNKSIDISADGQWLAIGTYGAGLGLFDLKNPGNEARYFPNVGKNIEVLKFAPDGKTIIACSDSNLLEFNVTSGAGIVAGSVDGYILSLDVSPDGKMIAAGTKNGKVVLWDRAKGYKKQILLTENKNQIPAVAFNHKGDMLACGEVLGYLKTWDLKENKLLANVKGHSARITCIRFSPDDKTIATASYDQAVNLWNADNLNDQPIKLKDHESWVIALAFSPFGDKLVTGSTKENRLILWPTRTYAIAELVSKKIDREFTKEEWATYVGKDITYEKVK